MEYTDWGQKNYESDKYTAHKNIVTWAKNMRGVPQTQAAE